MKIRRVEIQAFRAYDQVGDSTFDFILPNGENADFVSIYAPNGFGKTSFYDAVEWGMTNNIHRFTRQSQIKDYAHDEKQLKLELDNENSPHYFLRNKNSTDDVSSYVKLYLDSKKTITRTLEHNLRKNGSDFSFEEKKTTNIFFRDVILSQDNIDAFLREDDPQKRYIKFMEFFGDRELDRHYNNILILLRANEANIISLKNQIVELEKSQQIELDVEILEKVNFTVKELTNRGEELEIITSRFSDKDFLRFSNAVSQRTFVLGQDVENLYSKLEAVDNYRLKARDVLDKAQRLKEYNAKISEIEKITTQFEEMKNLQIEFENLQEHISVLTNQVLYSRDLASRFSNYQEITKVIEDKLTSISKIQADINKIENQVRNYDKELSTLKATIDQSNKDYLNTKTKLSELPTNKQNILDITISVQTNSKLIKQIEVAIAQANTQILELKDAHSALENTITRISLNDFILEISFDKYVGELIQKIRSLLELLQSQNKKLNETNDRITSSSLLNNDIKKIIVLGTNIVNKTKSSACPLCSHDFLSFEALSNSLLQNQLLDKEIQVLFETKQSLNDFISDTTGSIAGLKNEILALKDQELQDLKLKISQADQKVASLKLEREKLRSQSTHDNTILQQIIVSAGGDNFEKLEKGFIEAIEKTKALLDVTTNSFNSKLEERNKLLNDVDLLKIDLRLADSEIIKAKSTGHYLFILSYIENLNAESEIDEKHFSDLLLSNQNLLKDTNSKIDFLRRQIEPLAEILLKYNEITLIEDANRLKQSVATYDENLRNFLNTVRDEFGIDISDSISDIELTKRLNDFSESLRANLIDRQNKIDNYSLLERYKNNVIPFLKFKDTETKIKQLTSEINFKANRVKSALIQEKEMLSKFINQQIESFFFEDLINKLYRKIDPHPEYKSIKFRCDFDEGKPKLNVYVVSRNSTNLIPNLYFSTAQMNILSLSIFLAKALNAQDSDGRGINCIFIDDPIQSMDSINILSTIDLLRSIVVNFKKQIILSTHDENFYHLLQKKIPPEYFSAKYIELSSFGKVNQNSKSFTN